MCSRSHWRSSWKGKANGTQLARSEAAVDGTAEESTPDFRGARSCARGVREAAGHTSARKKECVSVRLIRSGSKIGDTLVVSCSGES